MPAITFSSDVRVDDAADASRGETSRAHPGRRLTTDVGLPKMQRVGRLLTMVRPPMVHATGTRVHTAEDAADRSSAARGEDPPDACCHFRSTIAADQPDPAHLSRWTASSRGSLTHIMWWALAWRSHVAVTHHADVSRPEDKVAAFQTRHRPPSADSDLGLLHVTVSWAGLPGGHAACDLNKAGTVDPRVGACRPRDRARRQTVSANADRRRRPGAPAGRHVTRRNKGPVSEPRERAVPARNDSRAPPAKSSRERRRTSRPVR